MRLLFTLILLFAVSSIFGKNLIKNGDFTASAESGVIPGWMVWPEKLSGDVKVRLTSTESYSGGVSVCITHKHDQLYTRIDQLRVPCKPHTQYIARFYVKGQNLRTSQKSGARMFIGPHGDLQYAICSFGPGLEHFKRDVPNPWSFDWTLYESPVFNSGDSRELGITLYLHFTSGTIWFDNVELYEYSSDLKKVKEAEFARKLLRNDVDLIAGTVPELKNELGDIRTEIEKYFPKSSDHRNGMPFYEPQKKLGVLLGRVLQQKFPERKVIASLAKDPLISQSAYFVPSGVLPTELQLEGMAGETENFAVNLTNTTTQEQQVEIKIPEKLELISRLAVHVATDRGTIIDDALPLLSGINATTYKVKIPAGMTRQIYFSVLLRKQESGAIHFGEEQMQIKLKPKNEKFPAEVPIALFSYAYPYQFNLYQRAEHTRKIRFSMHNNAIYPYQFDSPLPVFDANGKFYPDKMNWGKFDFISSMTPRPQKVLIYLPVHTHPHITQTLGMDGTKRLEVYSAEWKRRIIVWLRALVTGMKHRGIGYDRLLLVLMDEPPESAIPYMEKVSAVIREADPKLRIYNNFHYSISSAKLVKLTRFLDVLAPEIAEMTPEKMEILKKSGKEIWCYHVQNRSYPGNKIRDLFRFLHRKNVRGYSYWCFYDNASQWGSQHGYAVVYDGSQEEWIPSKRSEGIRKGIEDYALLEWMKNKDRSEYEKLMKKSETISRDELRTKILKKMK